MFESLQHLAKRYESRKKSIITSSCSHLFLEYRGPCFICADCSTEVTEVVAFPSLFRNEINWMKKLGDDDNSDVADTIHHRGVTISFLVEFCRIFNLWDVSVDEVRRNYIIPITCEKRCRFVDLPIMKEGNGVKIVGQADTYIFYTRKSKFGDLVSSISDGADPNRRVWLDLFASRQLVALLEDRLLHRVCHPALSVLLGVLP